MSEENNLLILKPNTMELKKLMRYKELENRGIQEPELTRAVEAEFTDYPTPTDITPWPGPVTGIDNAGPINLDLIFASKSPPFVLPQENFAGPYSVSNVNPYPNNPTPDPNSIGSMSNTYDFTNFPAPESNNWLGLAAPNNAETPTVGIEGFNSNKAIPEWRREDVEQSQVYPSKIPDIILPPSGELNETILKPIREAIDKIREQFEWLGDEYITNAKELASKNNGQLYLIRAAQATITDHTSEGEKYRRKLTGQELQGMARTAIKHGMDVNHDSTFKTQATILDSDYDTKREEIQMVVLEKDPQINQYIRNGSITAVSINGGNPRRQVIEPCDDNCTSNCEMCNVPQGVILGEDDSIALTWVVTDPRGIFYKGQHIESAEAGIKNTKIEIL